MVELKATVDATMPAYIPKPANLVSVFIECM